MGILTDKTEKTTAPAIDDWVHSIDKSNTTANAAGTSFKQTIGNFLKGRGLLLIQGCLTIKASGKESLTALEVGDFVLYQDVTADEFLIATIKATITTVPADLRDSAKTALWYDGSAAL